MSDDLQITGLCRFSYRTGGGSGFRRDRGTVDLHDPERLARRLWLFENLCLPGIRAQSDRDFRLVILVGASLPDRIRARLLWLTADLPEVVIHGEAEGQPHAEVCARSLLTWRERDRPWSGEFCMDDDDCLARDFVAEVRRRFALLRPLAEADNRLELDFCRGYAARVTGDRLEMKPVVVPHWAPAQIFFLRSTARRTAFNLHHSRWWRRNTAVSVAGPPMFIRGFHEFNDSPRDWSRIMESTPLPATAARALAARFGLDPRTIAAAAQEAA